MEEFRAGCFGWGIFLRKNEKYNNIIFQKKPAHFKDDCIEKLKIIVNETKSCILETIKLMLCFLTYGKIQAP